MINQVDFEGYLTRAWEYREQRFMRLANHRPGENGKTLSDYVTVQIDPSLDFDPHRVKIGRLLRVTGRIVGRDIVEPLKMVVEQVPRRRRAAQRTEHPGHPPAHRPDPGHPGQGAPGSQTSQAEGQGRQKGKTGRKTCTANCPHPARCGPG